MRLTEFGPFAAKAAGLIAPKLADPKLAQRAVEALKAVKIMPAGFALELADGRQSLPQAFSRIAGIMQAAEFDNLDPIVSRIETSQDPETRRILLSWLNQDPARTLDPRVVSLQLTLVRRTEDFAGESRYGNHCQSLKRAWPARAGSGRIPKIGAFLLALLSTSCLLSGTMARGNSLTGHGIKSAADCRPFVDERDKRGCNPCQRAPFPRAYAILIPGLAE
jgi:hypothetical protein